MVDNVQNSNQKNITPTGVVSSAIGGALAGLGIGQLKINSLKPNEDKYIKSITERLNKGGVDSKTLESTLETAKKAFKITQDNFKRLAKKIRIKWAAIGASVATTGYLAVKHIQNRTNKEV